MRTRPGAALLTSPDAIAAVATWRLQVEDLISYGFLPEFVGRFPVLAKLEALTREQMVHVMTRPRNALLKQYVALFAADGITLSVSRDAVYAIATQADRTKTGARGLRSIVENALNEQRNKTFKLGYRPPTTTEGATPSGATPSGATPSSAAASDAQGGLVEKSSVQLRTLMRTSDDEATRRAAWEGLRSIGPFVLGNGLCEMVKLRNALAKKLG